MRTTVDIDDPLLKELKKLRKIEGKSLGRMISDLLAIALQSRRSSEQRPEQPRWISRDMGARINLDDKEALYKVLDDRKSSAEMESVKP